MIKMSELFKDTHIDNTKIIMERIIEYMEIEGFDAIDWDDCMRFLRSFSKNHDGYNIYPDKINDKNDLLELDNKIRKAFAGQGPMIRRICMDCHKEFYIYISEMCFFEDKGLALPKRCKDCRKKKYAEKNQGVSS